ncbi:MAG: hypothetical protein ABL959_12360 [Pyrinomonadaceae bacterium]
MKNFIVSFAIGLMLCIGVFAIPIPDIPASEPSFVNVTSTAPAIVTRVDVQPINHFEVTQAVATEGVAATSPSDTAMAADAKATTNRTATVSGTNQFRAATDTSPPPNYNGKQPDQPLDNENDYVPLGPPKPVEATARNGSFT